MCAQTKREGTGEEMGGEERRRKGKAIEKGLGLPTLCFSLYKRSMSLLLNLSLLQGLN